MKLNCLMLEPETSPCLFANEIFEPRSFYCAPCLLKGYESQYRFIPEDTVVYVGGIMHTRFTSLNPNITRICGEESVL